MIWIAWRFQRSVVVALAFSALVLIGVILITGIVQHHDLVQYMAAPCHGHQVRTPRRGDLCGELAVKLDNIQAFNNIIRVAGYIVAPLVGALLGLLAVASEVDNRTVRLAWTQSISRTRWFVAKAGVGAVLVTMILVPTAIVLSWWSGTIGDRDLFARETYGIAGWDLVAYGLFMFALTLLLGAVIRRVGWALAASVLLFLLAAFSLPSQVRSHLVAPTVKWSEPYVVTNGDFTGSAAPYPYNAWLLVQGVVPRSTTGIPTYREVSATYPRVGSCIVKLPTKTESEYVKAELECYKKFHVENVAVYIADDQFWTLQFREGLLCLAAGVIMAGGALLIIRRIEP